MATMAKPLTANKEQQAKIDAAEIATQDRVIVHLAVSRQDYRDAVEAFHFLRQTSPWMKSVGQRLEKLGLAIREAIDKGDDASVTCTVVSKSRKGHDGNAPRQ